MKHNRGDYGKCWAQRETSVRTDSKQFSEKTRGHKIIKLKVCSVLFPKRNR